MNTVIDYMYADGTNCKTSRQWVITGPSTPEQIAALGAACMNEGDRGFFVPSAVGMPGLAPCDWSNGIDHGMCFIQDVEPTDQRADDPRTIDEMVEAFRIRDWERDAELLERVMGEVAPWS